MPRIKSFNYRTSKIVTVGQSNFEFGYVNTCGKRVPKNTWPWPYGHARGKKGRFLEITSKSDNGISTVRLNGTQINTLKRVLQEAGEVL